MGRGDNKDWVITNRVPQGQDILYNYQPKYEDQTRYVQKV